MVRSSAAGSSRGGGALLGLGPADPETASLSVYAVDVGCPALYSNLRCSSRLSGSGLSSRLTGGAGANNSFEAMREDAVVLDGEGSLEVWASSLACASAAWRFKRASRRRRAREGGTLRGGGMVGIVDEVDGVIVERGFAVDVVGWERS